MTRNIWTLLPSLINFSGLRKHFLFCLFQFQHIFQGFFYKWAHKGSQTATTAERTRMRHEPKHFDSCTNSSEMLRICERGFMQVLDFSFIDLKHMNRLRHMRQEGQLSHRHKPNLSEFVVHISGIKNLYFSALFRAKEPSEAGWSPKLVHHQPCCF